MLQDELLELITTLRRFGVDHASVEAKASQRGLPQRLWEALSAFSNTDGGGTIILGIDESSGFQVVGVEDVKKVQADLSAMCADMEPALSPPIQILEVEGKTVVVAEIAELPGEQKPCYYRPQGPINGSYLRVGDSNRKMTAYDLHAIQEAKGQPRQDLEPVPSTGTKDLDPALLEGFLRRIRTKGRNFQDRTNEELLNILKVTVDDGYGKSVLSLGGLLCLGSYPQSHFPSLCLAIVRYPGTEAGVTGPSGERFMENVKLEGPIPYMVQEGLNVIKRNIQRRDIIQGLGRTEQWEYPELVLREALVNALAHRDLSYMARGSHVQVQIYPDRLEIVSPGGLYGPIQQEQLGIPGIQSSRNEFLIKILEDLPLPHDNHTVCEGRGSGITAILKQLRQAGMSPPRFDISLTRFRVSFSSHTLLSSEVLTWVSQLTAGHAVAESQRKALAYLHHAKVINNVDYCRVAEVNSNRATRELRQLVDLAVLEKVGNGRWMEYRLVEPSNAKQEALPGLTTTQKALQPKAKRPSHKDTVLEAFAKVPVSLSISEVAIITELPNTTIRHWVRKLAKEGMLVMDTSHPNSPTTSYRLTHRTV